MFTVRNVGKSYRSLPKHPRAVQVLLRHISGGGAGKIGGVIASAAVLAPFNPRTTHRKIISPEHTQICGQLFLASATGREFFTGNSVTCGAAYGDVGASLGKPSTGQSECTIDVKHFLYAYASLCVGRGVRDEIQSHLSSSHRLPKAKSWEVLSAKKCNKYLILLATPAGFEPATFSLEGCCSIP